MPWKGLLQRFGLQLFSLWLVIYGPPILALQENLREHRLRYRAGEVTARESYSAYGRMLSKHFIEHPPGKRVGDQPYVFTGEPWTAAGLAYHGTDPSGLLSTSMELGISAAVGGVASAVEALLLRAKRQLL